jgi:hypothetical protein
MIQQNSRGSRAALRSPSLHSGGLLLFLAAFLGCGSTDGLDRQAISGVVTLDGLPIMSGAILFEPATDRSGTAVGATVRKGEFTISKHEGPVPGRYRVRVYASSEIQAPPTKGQTDRTPRPMVERLPARYNTQTVLGADVVVRRVNHFRFELNSGASSELR